MTELSRHQKRMIRHAYGKFNVIQTQLGRDMADCLDEALRDAILGIPELRARMPNRWVPAVKRIGVKTFTGLTILPGEYLK